VSNPSSVWLEKGRAGVDPEFGRLKHDGIVARPPNIRAALMIQGVEQPEVKSEYICLFATPKCSHIL
jgi:hypothetical protein